MTNTNTNTVKATKGNSNKTNSNTNKGNQAKATKTKVAQTATATKGNKAKGNSKAKQTPVVEQPKQAIQFGTHIALKPRINFGVLIPLTARPKAKGNSNKLATILHQANQSKKSTRHIARTVFAGKQTIAKDDFLKGLADYMKAKCGECTFDNQQFYSLVKSYNLVQEVGSNLNRNFGGM